MGKTEKLDYSKRKTLNNLGEGYSITLKNKVTVLGVKDGTFKKGDEIIINKIILKNEKPHHVTLTVKREGEEVENIDMSGGVFLSNFIAHIDEGDIILKNKDENQEKVKKILDK